MIDYLLGVAEKVKAAKSELEEGCPNSRNARDITSFLDAAISRLEFWAYEDMSDYSQ